ncbi:MAG: PD-(D/E)XK nuclease family protein [archaeon]
MTLLLNQIIQTSFKHGWFYHYRINVAHMENHCNNGFSNLRSYLTRVFDLCPDEKFSEGPRSSALKFPIPAPLKEDSTHTVCAQAKEGLATMDTYRTAHSKVQVYMLKKDRNTIAIEVPLWLDSFEYPRFRDLFGCDGALSGHIDVLKVLDNKIQILDYKPKAHKEKYAATQTYFYALMLATRTGIPLEKMECGYFDDSTSYFFDPSSVMLS